MPGWNLASLEHVPTVADFVVRGRVRFTVGEETAEAGALSVLAVREPALERSAVALEPGTTLIALGGVPRPDFHSTWRPEHFEGVERLT